MKLAALAMALAAASAAAAPAAKVSDMPPRGLSVPMVTQVAPPATAVPAAARSEAQCRNILTTAAAVPDYAKRYPAPVAECRARFPALAGGKAPGTRSQDVAKMPPPVDLTKPTPS